MDSPVSKKVVLYSALFITCAVNIPRLFAMNKDGLLGRLAPFNIYLWTLQIVVSFAFCGLLFYLNKDRLHYFSQPWNWKKHGRLFLYNFFVTLCCAVAAGILSRILFRHEGVLKLNGYVLRLLFIAVLIGIECKVLATIYKAQVQERENEQLRHANTMMELALLKAQLNPHFFFNALSSLSGVVRENPGKAQHYIAHLSRIFRYSLNKSKESLVTLEEELNEIYSYSELMKMRFEEGFHIHVQVDRQYYTAQLPHMSLQPLIENALKHNLSTKSYPLKVDITFVDQYLVVQNNLQLKTFPEPGSGIGLANLGERFRILLGMELEISKTSDAFIIKLPLKQVQL
jgi:sensor histidine kinase YesM